jgi:hypothetical protein
MTMTVKLEIDTAKQDLAREEEAQYIFARG